MESRDTVEHAQVLYLLEFMLGFDAGLIGSDLWIWYNVSIGPRFLHHQPGYRGPRLPQKGARDAM